MKKEDIKSLRKKLKLSQERFAALLGTTLCTVARWETGKCVPSQLAIRQLNLLKGRTYGTQTSERQGNEFP